MTVFPNVLVGSFSPRLGKTKELLDLNDLVKLHTKRYPLFKLVIFAQLAGIPVWVYCIHY